MFRVFDITRLKGLKAVLELRQELHNVFIAETFQGNPHDILDVIDPAFTLVGSPPTGDDGQEHAPLGRHIIPLTLVDVVHKVHAKHRVVQESRS